MKTISVTVKETHDYNSIAITAEFDEEPTDQEILKLRSRAHRLIREELIVMKTIRPNHLPRTLPTRTLPRSPGL